MPRGDDPGNGQHPRRMHEGVPDGYRDNGPGRCWRRRPCTLARRGCLAEETEMNDERKAAGLARAGQALGQHGAVAADVLGRLWDESFEQGRLAALDELQDRFCVCMK